MIDKIYKEFIFGGHMMALSAALLYVFFGVAFNINITILSFVLIYLIVEPIYMFDRWRDFKSDYEENIERSKHIEGYIKYIGIILALYILTALGISLGISFIIGMPIVVFTVLIISSGILYPILAKKITKFIPLFKNFYVAVFFSFVPVIIYVISGDLTASNLIRNGEMLFYIFYIFALSMFIQIFFDVKDIKSDKKAGLITLPVLLDKDRTLELLAVCFLLLGGLSLYFLISTENPIYLAYLTVSLVPIYVIRKAFKEIKYSYFILIGFQYILFVLIGILVQIVFNG